MRCIQARFPVVTVLVTVLFMLVATGAASARDFQTLHKFGVHGTDGCWPGGRLTLDAAGNLYGTTYTGGTAGQDCNNNVVGGTVFRLTPNPDGSWTENVLYSFPGGASGGSTYAPVILDAAGNLYGTTLHGGGTGCSGQGCGTIFRLIPNPDGTWTEHVLYTFTGNSDGGAPFAGLVFDSSGSLYGTTYDYGAFGGGTVFKLAPNPDGTWKFSVLYTFGAFRHDAFNGYSGVILDAAGNIYGTTAFGGTDEVGTVFKLSPNPDGSWTESILHSFTGHDGEWCYPGLVLDGAGNLYGMTTGGGLGAGVVFRLAPHPDGSWKFTRLHTFRGAYGENPIGGLVADAAGNLYGATQYSPTVFKLMPNPDGSWKIVRLHRFKGKDGDLANGSLTFDGAGNLYGTTFTGGHGGGVVYKITP